MGITESEYSCYLSIIRRLKAAKPAPGSPAAEKLELYEIRARWYEWERSRPPAGSTPPDIERAYALLDRVLTPEPIPTARPSLPSGPRERPTAPRPHALRDGDSAPNRR